MATDMAPELCFLPDCGQPRYPVFLGWHGNDAITSPYCVSHGPKRGMAPPSGTVWPDGIQPAGVVNGKVVVLR